MTPGDRSDITKSFRVHLREEIAQVTASAEAQGWVIIRRNRNTFWLRSPKGHQMGCTTNTSDSRSDLRDLVKRMREHGFRMRALSALPPDPVSKQSGQT